MSETDLTFGELVDDVLGTGTGSRFNAGQRAKAKRWLNYVYGKLLGLEEWTFLKASANVTVTAGNRLVSSVPTTLGPVVGLYRDDGLPLEYLSPTEYEEAFFADTSSNLTGAFTVLAGTVMVGPTPSASGTYLLVHEQLPVPMSDEAETPIVPASHRYVLVPGAQAVGLKLENDPTWQALQQEYQEGIDAMRRVFLTVQRGARRQWGRDPMHAR